MGKISKGVLRLGALVIILALVMVLAIPALAESPKSVTPAATTLHTIQGKVISNTSTSFDIQNGDQPKVTVNTDANTKYYLINTGRAQGFVNSVIAKDNQQFRKAGLPQLSREADLRNAHIPANWRDNLGWLETFNKSAQFSDIQDGDRIIARVTNDGNNLAKQILIIKAPVIRTVKGTVNSVTADSLSILPSGSTTALLLAVTPQTRITLKGITIIAQGQTVVAVYNSAKNNSALTVNIQAP
jgi:hypothetical protein